MRHADVDENSEYISSVNKFKSRIGGLTQNESGLAVSGSKPAKNENQG